MKLVPPAIKKEEVHKEEEKMPMPMQVRETTTQPDKKKKRKKCNKKKKEVDSVPVEDPQKKVDDDDAYLERIIEQIKEEKKMPAAQQLMRALVQAETPWVNRKKPLFTPEACDSIFKYVRINGRTEVTEVTLIFRASRDGW